MSSPSSKVGIIIHSVRNPRVGPSVASFVKSIIDARPSPNPNITYSFIDVADFKLPVFDEPNNPQVVPMFGLSYTQDHTKRWAAEISSYQGFVFVTPEYNFGIPGATKNAIDYLWQEWTTKPGMVVSYGANGGNLSNAALTQTLEGMKMKVSPTKVILPFKGGLGPDMMEAHGGGKLGEATSAWWMETKKDDVLKAVEELEENLKVYRSELEAKSEEK